jgi:hypothetical protein
MFVWVGMFVFGIMVMDMRRGVIGNGKGIHHVLQVLVAGPLCAPVNHFSKEFLVHGKDVVDQAAGALEKASHLTGVVLVQLAHAVVHAGAARKLGAALVDP